MESPLRRSVPHGTRLIETFGWRPDEGFRHLDRHLARMENSANALGFVFDRDWAEVLLQAKGDAPLRCRLTLGQDGFDFVSVPMAEVKGPWKVRLSDKRLASDDNWLRHKTTQRALYDQERAALPDGIDEWIFANEVGMLCEGTITNLFVTRPDGKVITPPVSSGVLPGILREVLLEQGKVLEAPISLDDLYTAHEIHLGNSLRGLIKSELHTE